jgi:hypothetical protein
MNEISNLYFEGILMRKKRKREEKRNFYMALILVLLTIAILSIGNYYERNVVNPVLNGEKIKIDKP